MGCGSWKIHPGTKVFVLQRKTSSAIAYIQERAA
jgi:hypothetical protein